MTTPADGVPNLLIMERTTTLEDGVPPNLSKPPTHLTVVDGVHQSPSL